MKPLGRALQLIDNKKKQVFSSLNKVNMTDEQLKDFCSAFLGDDTESFLMMCDRIEVTEKTFLARQKKVTALWFGFIGYKLMDLNFLNEVQKRIKEFKVNQKKVKVKKK